MIEIPEDVPTGCHHSFLNQFFSFRSNRPAMNLNIPQLFCASTERQCVLLAPVIINIKHITRSPLSPSICPTYRNTSTQPTLNPSTLQSQDVATNFSTHISQHYDYPDSGSLHRLFSEFIPQHLDLPVQLNPLPALFIERLYWNRHHDLVSETVYSPREVPRLVSHHRPGRF